MLLFGLLLATALGTLFSGIYPRVEIDVRLASLFVLVGLSIAYAIKWLWHVIGSNKK